MYKAYVYIDQVKRPATLRPCTKRSIEFKHDVSAVVIKGTYENVLAVLWSATDWDERECMDEIVPDSGLSNW